ncbi:SDR family NAD(P)-dependent oxidoreductase [Shewanella zhangzhouensis]|uniref:SDR family NAD(P)-dependent oxidoreductase n=1 Tax=Shewanella zhangzhouensis TaxID=2864213 RepID=UPI001C65B195|nr:SDR family oxidoreductase [Shewanella zhangzhouensis]QYK03920.1 SDR family oxidoreductase [Shewanella zhangzhouensis]
MEELTLKKWVLITGALGGIGQALVQEFSIANYNVIATDVREIGENFEHLDDIKFLQSDLDKIAQCEIAATSFHRKVHELTNGQGINALINNAAIQIVENSQTLTRQQWNKTLNVNLLAPFYLSQIFVNELSNNSGSIVNISSIHATNSKKDFVAYATSKAALSALTRNMVLDLGSKVRINAIEPAAIATEMLKEGFLGREEQYRRLEEFHPIGRVGTPSEVAKLAVFLSSESAGFVQGACISASGGIKSCLSDPS